MDTNIVPLRDRQSWDWKDVQDELKNMGGLDGVRIDPRSQQPRGSATPNFMAGMWKGTGFTFSWVKGKFISVSMERALPELLRAFTILAGKKPFCSYTPTLIGWPTFEWSWVDAAERYKELENVEEVVDLKKIE